MSSSGSGNSGNPMFGARPRAAGGGANFDTTVGHGNRDAWNNPIRDNSRSQQNDDPPPNDGRTRNDTPNNDGIDDDTIATIWDKIDKKNKAGDPPPNQQITPQQQPVVKSPADAMKDYLTGIGLSDLTLTDQEKETVIGGDPSPMLQKINAMIVQSHVKGLSGAETMIQKAVKDAMAEARTESGISQANREALNALHGKLPWTKDKAISPVAQSVLQRFLDRDMPLDKAIEGVSAYFDHMDRKRGVNTNRNGNFSSDNRDRNEPPEAGWLHLLTGQNSSR